jgi:hypothetical protein
MVDVRQDMLVEAVNIIREGQDEFLDQVAEPLEKLRGLV